MVKKSLQNNEVEQSAPQDTERLARELLDITPKLLRCLNADLPLEGSREASPGWRDVVELRATPGQLTLMRILVEHGRCTMQELAEHLAVAPSTATAMVKRLLVQGYIERNHDDIDWRTVWVKPTEAGRRAVNIFDSARLAALQHHLEQLSDQEHSSLLTALPALYHLIEV